MLGSGVILGQPSEKDEAGTAVKCSNVSLSLCAMPLPFSLTAAVLQGSNGLIDGQESPAIMNLWNYLTGNH